MGLLAHRLDQLGRAIREGEGEDDIRAELRALADEATLLSKTYPLLPSLLDRRQRVAAERGVVKRDAA